ncbi:Oidioi.mRNA.OKI2018_I69.XSR.g16223.t1.cds [Oikopleura dioica]|uniref:Cleavage stimulation factor 50 kDa subunit n=1 Tax=Oikopleura dioica TaxID=34765 RepID=A0ABN7SFE8_OIKDI|nr:Oidioi.mRNA.OKI2018_I69.XSR.g16223.t1.cds [Oikopleura dioica]
MSDPVKDKDKLYRLIIGQLQFDGYIQVSKNLAQQARPSQGATPSDQLMKIFQAGLQTIELESPPEEKTKLHTADDADGLDLESELVGGVLSPDPSVYETCYVTAHKGACRAAAWTKDGSYVATGSVDSSIKILDVERMVAKASLPMDMGNQSDASAAVDHPVIRTLYDHLEEVTTLAFHPFEQKLISGSKDYTIKVFDWSRSSAKKAQHTIQEVEWIRCLSLHPSGDWLVVGTQHPTIRFYDLHTTSCFTSPVQRDHHRGPITTIHHSTDAKMFCSSSKDGTIKLWDGVSHRCIATWERAHEGYEVCSVQFTKNGKYLLSSGKDSICRLWEISTGRPILTYTGAELSGRNMHRSNACFNHTEEHVLFPCEKNISMCAWNSRTADRGKLLALGHNSIARMISHSPTQSAFLSCSDDFRARFWYHKTTSI